MIGAAQQVALRLRVGLNADSHSAGDLLHGVAQRGLVERQRGQDGEREDRAELIEVDVGHQLLLGDGGMLREVARAEESFLLARDDGEQERSLEFRAGFVQPLGHVDQSRDVSRIVEGAVVDAVAIPGFAEAVAVEVRGNDDVFAGQRGVAAGQHRQDVVGFEIAAGGPKLQPEPGRQIEARQRLALRGQGSHLAVGVAGAFEQEIGEGGIEAQGERRAGGRLSSRERHGLGVGGRPAGRLGAGGGVDREDGGHARGRAIPGLTAGSSQTHQDLALQAFGARIGACEDEGRVQALRQSGASRRYDLPQPFEFPYGISAHQFRPGLIGEQADLVHRHGLVVSLLAGRLQTGALELRDDVARGITVGLGAGFASFHSVVGQRLYVRPPAAGRIIRLGGKQHTA